VDNEIHCLASILHAGEGDGQMRKPELRRDLDLIAAVAVGLGAIIGAGIFVVTGVAAGVAGPAFIVGLF
jgi:amino acid transporter